MTAYRASAPECGRGRHARLREKKLAYAILSEAKDLCISRPAAPASERGEELSK
jgi:hypothetical protein